MNIEEILKMDIPDLEVNKTSFKDIIEEIKVMECLHHKMGISTSSLSILLDSEPIEHDKDCNCREDNHFIVKYKTEYFLFLKNKEEDFYKINGKKENKLHNELINNLRKRHTRLEMFMS
ncbi:hypothetical protein LCGC14_0854870 [marine sediment metagenome]|uniref:Uncharacterized protein n=1 Tax=marine sediment metagenome TaxID=412755 RepID=A0A0F9RTQ7_9ZZZZ